MDRKGIIYILDIIIFIVRFPNDLVEAYFRDYSMSERMTTYMDFHEIRISRLDIGSIFLYSNTHAILSLMNNLTYVYIYKYIYIGFAI